MSTVLKKVPIGVDNFRRLVDPSNHFIFVDKTLMLKEFIDRGTQVSLIIRPRRWGKTLNMSMIQHFFSPTVNGERTKGLFDHLKIAKENNGSYVKQYQGKHPVLFISFKDLKQENFGDFLDKTNTLLQRLCHLYPELTTSKALSTEEHAILNRIINKTANAVELCGALETLSLFLYKHYKSTVIILIDEYDTPLNAAYGKSHFDSLINFFKNMFGSALKGNDALEKGIMTGILRLSKNKMLSDLKNLKLYSLMDERYSAYFGFSETEVKSLFDAAQVSTDIQKVKEWYNGYYSGGYQNVYNPWSILNCIEDGGQLKPYWIKTGNESLIKSLFLNASVGIKEKLNLLLIGQPIESFIDEYCSFDEIQGNEEALWSLLWALGYLKTTGQPQLFGARYHAQLAIPNQEVAASYRDVFQTFMNALPNAFTYHSFLKNLSQGNVELFLKELTHYMSTIPSWFDFPQESNYHTFLLGLTASMGETHHIYSNREVGYGRPDILLIPRNTLNALGLILEFKKDDPNKDKHAYDQLALQGLTQIDMQKYDAFLLNTPHVHRILKMCIVFFGKQLVCKWAFDKIVNLNLEVA
jgi:hypothetical protein